MIIDDIFTNILAVEKLNLDNDKISKFCYANDLGNKKKSNYLKFDEPELKEMYDAVLSTVNQLHSALGFTNKAEQVFKNAWFNINGTPYIDIPHIHQGVMFTMVYYPKAEEGKSTLQFVNPIGAHAFAIYPSMIDNTNRFNSNFWNYHPKTGDLVIFPAWLMHYVIQEEHQDDRISIAFNTYIKEK